MRNNKIFILTSTIDYPVETVIKEINELGYSAARFDVDKILTNVEYNFLLSNELNKFYFNQDNINLFNSNDFKNIHSVWDTGTLPIEEIIHAVSGKIGFENPHVVSYLKVEHSRFIQSFLSLLSDTFWVNHYLDSYQAESKISNLILAKKLGLNIPNTIISNSKEEITSFLGSFESDGIIKTFTFFEFTENQELKVCFAKKKSRDEILSNLSHIYYPVFIQEYIEKIIELRIVIVGTQVFAVAIHSQESDFTKEDWRTSDVSKLKHEVYELPKKVQSQLLQFCKIRNLHFAAFDFILNTRNELVFLECNPKGEWYWLEEETGIPLAKSIAKLLVNKKN